MAPHDGNDIFRYTTDNEILPYVKIRKNTIVLLKKGQVIINLSVICQKNDLKR